MINMTTYSASIIRETSELITSLDIKQDNLNKEGGSFFVFVDNLKNSGEMRKQMESISEKISFTTDDIDCAKKEHDVIRCKINIYAEQASDVIKKLGRLNELKQKIDGSNKGSGKFGYESVLRMKNGKLKALNTGCVKNLFNKERYAKETAAARKEFGTQDNNVTIGFMEGEIEVLEFVFAQYEKSYLSVIDDCEKLNEKLKDVDARQVEISKEIELVGVEFEKAIKRNITGRAEKLDIKQGFDSKPVERRWTM